MRRGLAEAAASQALNTSQLSAILGTYESLRRSYQILFVAFVCVIVHGSAIPDR
jgi:hypothetical protein